MESTSRFVSEKRAHEGEKLARQIVTREKISELLESLVLRWARMSFFRGLWKSSSKHKSKSRFGKPNERTSERNAFRKIFGTFISKFYLTIKRFLQNG